MRKTNDSDTEKARLSPAAMGLTNAEYQVFSLMAKRQNEGGTITTAFIAKEWQQRSRSWTYRILKSLIKKGYVERYSHQYYRIITTTPKQ